MRCCKYLGYGHIALDFPNKKVEMLKDDEKVSSPHSSSSKFFKG